MSRPPSITAEAITLLKQGQDYYANDPPDYAAAEECFRKAIDSSPEWGEPFHWLAVSLRSQNKLKQACDTERKAIDLLPGDPRPLLTLGYFLVMAAQYAEAIPFFEQGLKLKPHYAEADARLGLAEAFERLGQIEKATALWRQIVKMDPFFPSEDRPMEEARKKLKEHGLFE